MYEDARNEIDAMEATEKPEPEPETEPEAKPDTKPETKPEKEDF